MPRSSWLFVALLVGPIVAGCSTRHVPPAAVLPVPVDLAPAHTLVEAGCYRCLVDAYGLYERALNDPAAGPDARSRLDCRRFRRLPRHCAG